MSSQYNLIHLGVEFYSRLARGLVLFKILGLWPHQRDLEVLTATFHAWPKLFQSFWRMQDAWSGPDRENKPEQVWGCGVTQWKATAETGDGFGRKF